MKRAIFAIIVLLAAFPASAETADFQDKDGSWLRLIMPPAKYLEITNDNEIRYHVLPREQVRAECLYLTQQANVDGCAMVWPKACDVYLADDMPKPLFDATEQHEIAHCYGWPGHHPTDPEPEPLPDVVNYLIERYSGGR